MKRRRDLQWWHLLGCGLAWIPVVWLMVPIFYLGIWWMAANERPRRGGW